MRALVFDGSSLALAERADPVPSEGCAVVRVLRAGICSTDLEIVRGYMGFHGVLGHEFVGVVESGPEPWRGTRVVGEINFACGHCPRCEAGLGRHCGARSVMGIQGADGALAERVVVPVANLHPVPDAVDDEAAVFSEPLAAAYEILEQVDDVAGQRAVVLGDGKLGLLVAQVLAAAGARVKSVGRHPRKLALLAARDIETRDVADWSPGGEQADLVVEASGSGAGLALALQATRPRGTLVLKSTVAECPEVDLAPLVIDEIQLLGSRCGPFPPALAALEAGAVDVAPLISERFALDDAVQALERAAQPGVLKVLVDCT